MLEPVKISLEALNLAHPYADGAGFLLASFAFKLSLFPFHTWAPDVYEGASSPLAGYMSIVS